MLVHETGPYRRRGRQAWRVEGAVFAAANRFRADGQEASVSGRCSSRGASALSVGFSPPSRWSLAHPELVDKRTDLKVVLVVADARGDELDAGRVRERDDRRLVGENPVRLRP